MCVYVYNYICILYIDIIRFNAVGQLLPVAFPPSCSNAERAEGPRDTSPKHLSARPREFHHLTDIEQRPGALGALDKASKYRNPPRFFWGSRKKLFKIKISKNV